MGQSTCKFEILYYYPAIQCTDQKAGHICGDLVSKDRHRENTHKLSPQMNLEGEFTADH